MNPVIKLLAMITYRTIPILIGLLIISCDCNEDDIQPGSGFEIYRTETDYPHHVNQDYSLVDLDTIQLKDDPVLKYDDVISYDTVLHKLTLGISHDSVVVINPQSIFSNTFVVTVDNEPIYLGWFRSLISSIPVHWVYIWEPLYELDSLKDNEIIINFHYLDYWQKNPDPRLDPRIVERLARDGKIE